MKSQVLYGSMILMISVVLISTVAFSANADIKSHEDVVKGNGVKVDDKNGQFRLTVVPQPGGTYDITYDITVNNALEKARCLDITDKFVKISALKKATIEFNTGDISCDRIGGGPLSVVDISVKVQTTGDPDEPKPIDDDEGVRECDDNKCYVKVGTEQTNRNAEAIINITGEDELRLSSDLDNGDIVSITKVNTRWMEWLK